MASQRPYLGSFPVHLLSDNVGEALAEKKIRIFRQKQQRLEHSGIIGFSLLISEPQTFSIEFQLKVLIDTQLKDLRKYWKNYQKCKLISL